MSKSTKVLGLSILIFIALTMCRLAFMDIPLKVTSNVVEETGLSQYSYSWIKLFTCK